MRFCHCLIHVLHFLAGGVFSSILLALCLFWVGSVDGVGFHSGGQALDLSNLPVAIGIFGFGFSGHAVFPNIYSSMKDPSKFPLVLLARLTFYFILRVRQVNGIRSNFSFLLIYFAVSVSA